MKKKKTLSIDMDHVLVDFQSGVDQPDEAAKETTKGMILETFFKELNMNLLQCNRFWSPMSIK